MKHSFKKFGQVLQLQIVSVPKLSGSSDENRETGTSCDNSNNRMKKLKRKWGNLYQSWLNACSRVEALKVIKDEKNCGDISPKLYEWPLMMMMKESWRQIFGQTCTWRDTSLRNFSSLLCYFCFVCAFISIWVFLCVGFKFFILQILF